VAACSPEQQRIKEIEKEMREAGVIMIDEKRRMNKI
jgi:hypothetical protein